MIMEIGQMLGILEDTVLKQKVKSLRLNVKQQRDEQINIVIDNIYTQKNIILKFGRNSWIQA